MNAREFQTRCGVRGIFLLFFCLSLFIFIPFAFSADDSTPPVEGSAPPAGEPPAAPAPQTEGEGCDYLSVGTSVEPQFPEAGKKITLNAVVTYPKKNCDISYEWFCEDCGKITNADTAQASFMTQEPGFYKINLGIKLYFRDGTLAIQSPENLIEVEVSEESPSVTADEAPLKEDSN